MCSFRFLQQSTPQWKGHGVYQIGDDQARSLTVLVSSFGCATPARWASCMLQRQTGFSSTRA